jgi:hypothetical protein
MGVRWPDRLRPFWIYFELLSDECMVGVDFREGRTEGGEEFWSVGVYLLILRIRVSRSKE